MKKLFYLLAGVFLLVVPLCAQSAGPLFITGSGCAPIGTFNQSATVAVYVSGSWTGTIQPQGSIQGQSPFSLQVTPSTSSTAQSTITANGGYTALVAGLSSFQVCGNTVTGTATIFLNASTASSPSASGSSSTSGAAGFVFPSTAITAPTPLAATQWCPTGQAVLGYFQQADGNYQSILSTDQATVNPPNSPAGTLNWCGRMWINDTTVVMPGFKNRLLGIYHVPGLGGISPSATQDDSAVGAVWDNSAPGAVLDYHQSNTHYAEFLVGTTPNSWAGHAGGEVMGGVFRGSMNIGTGNFTGTVGGAIVTANGGGGFSTFSALATRSSANVTSSGCASGGCLQGFYSYAVNTATGSFGTGYMSSYVAAGADTAGCTSCGYIGFNAFAPSPRFGGTAGNFGIIVASFGTNATDYDMALSGVNASGTAAGFWSATGPAVFGAQAHAGAGVQLDIRGGNVTLASGFGYNINSDVGFSRASAGSMNLGNGTAGNSTGTLLLATLTASGTVSAGSANGFVWTSRSKFLSPSDGVIELTNAASTSFTRMQFGGATSSFTGFCTSATTVIQCLADGTAGGAFGAGGYTPVGIGTPTQVYNTAQTAKTAAQGATTMLANGAADANFRATFYVGQLNAGTGCVGAGSVGINVIFTDPITGNTYTEVLPIQNSGGIALLTSLVLTAGTPAVANTGWASINFRAKASTNIQYSTTYSAGGSCSVGQAYNIYPDLEAL